MTTRNHFYTRPMLAILLSVSGLGTAFAQIEDTAYGTGALAANTGNENSAFGADTLHSNTGGGANTGVGASALYSNIEGDYNIAIGWLALNANTNGSSNTAIGVQALYLNKTGVFNTGTGSAALQNNTGDYNTASGYQALFQNTTGARNIGIGFQSGYYVTTGSNNIEMSNLGRAADHGVIRIGTQGIQRFTAIAGISGVRVTGGVPVLVNAMGQLGVAPSSIRYKEDVHSMGSVSDRVLKLRPVTFRYKQPDEDGSKPEQYGLIAEEVAKVMPELVVYNVAGQPETVAYQTLTPLLLNELQRERQRSVHQERDLNRQLAAQAQQLKARDARVDSLEAQIVELRRVTAQLVAGRR